MSGTWAGGQGCHTVRGSRGTVRDGGYPEWYVARPCSSSPCTRRRSHLLVFKPLLGAGERSHLLVFKPPLGAGERSHRLVIARSRSRKEVSSPRYGPLAGRRRTHRLVIARLPAVKPEIHPIFTVLRLITVLRVLRLITGLRVLRGLKEA